MNQHIELFCGDCLDFMRGMPDKSVDITITDPPYGKKSDRAFIGVELDEHYFQIAEQRIHDTVKEQIS